MRVQLAAAVSISMLFALGCSGDKSTPGQVNDKICGGCIDGQHCLLNADFPKGACTSSCNPDGGSTKCASGYVCAALTVSPGGDADPGSCLKSCTSDSQCGNASLSCHPTGGLGAACVAAAIPEQIAATCPAPRLLSGGTVPATDPGTTCVRPRVPSALPGAQVQALGVHTVNELLPFNVAAGTVYLGVFEQAVSASELVDDGAAGLIPNTPSPSPLLVPGGGRFYFEDRFDQGPVDPTQASILYLTSAPSPSLLAFPNTSSGLALATDAGLPGGQWQVGVGDYARECLATPGCDGGVTNGQYDVTVVTRPGPIPAVGALDFGIYLITNGVLTSTTAVTDSRTVRFAQSMSDIYAKAGICVGSVTFYDVPEWAQTRFTTLPIDDADNACGDFRQVFTLGQPGNQMNLFFVSELVQQGTGGRGSIVGVDGAIPGPASFGGTVGGGAVVSAANLEGNPASCPASGLSLGCGADEVALISAHETGHFLGLFHSTEATGDVFDPLVDSPACLCTVCAAASNRARCSVGPDATLLMGSDCAQKTQVCGGGDLTMFWALSPSSLGTWSPEESLVLRANPTVAPR